MKRAGLNAFVTAGLLVCGLSQLPRAQSATVKLDVVVTDKAGKPITDLKQDELQIEDDGKKAEIKSVTAVTPPASQTPGEGRTVVLVLDDTAPANGTESIQTLASMILQSAPPGARVSVVRLHNNADALAFDAQSVMTRLSTYTAGVIPFDTRQSPNDLLERATKIAEGLTEPAGRRKAIVCVGAPALCAMAARSKNAQGNDWKIWTTAMNALARSNVSVYALMPVQLATIDVSLIDYTGGTSFTTGKFTDAAERIWAELGSNYIVEYAPASSGAKEVRGVTVKTTRRNAVVHARKQR